MFRKHKYILKFNANPSGSSCYLQPSSGIIKHSKVRIHICIIFGIRKQIHFAGGVEATFL